MKTAKSYTKEELGRYLVDLALGHIRSWADYELDKMRRSNKYTVCVPLGKHSWLIGPYVLRELDAHKWSLSKENVIVHVFYSKQAAIFYSILSKSLEQNKVKLARLLLTSDMFAAKYYDELKFYEKKLNSKKKTEEFKQQLWGVRRQETKLRFVQAQRDLEKNLKSAKYIKV